MTNVTKKRLHPASPAVPVLRVDEQPEARAAALGRGDRQQRRRRQPSVRHPRLLRRVAQAGNLPAVSYLKAPGYPGWPRRLFRSARRADISSSRSSTTLQYSRILEGHRDHHRLRRFGRLVRPSDAADRQSVGEPGRCADGRGRLRRRHDRAARHRCVERARPGTLRLRPAPAAAGPLAVGQAELRRPHADRPDLDPALHRRQLARRHSASARVRSTRSPARSRACSISVRARRSIGSSSTRIRASRRRETRSRRRIEVVI